MEIPNIDMNQEIGLRSLFTRFIRYAEANIINAKNGEDKSISLDEFKAAESDKTEKNQIEEYLDQVAINACDGIFDIIIAKVRIVTGVNIGDVESDVTFEDTFNIFKAAIEKAEEVYKAEGMVLFDMPVFTILDVISSVSAADIIEKYFAPEPQAAAAQEDQPEEKERVGER